MSSLAEVKSELTKISAKIYKMERPDIDDAMYPLRYLVEMNLGYSLGTFEQLVHIYELTYYSPEAFRLINAAVELTGKKEASRDKETGRLPNKDWENLEYLPEILMHLFSDLSRTPISLDVGKHRQGLYGFMADVLVNENIAFVALPKIRDIFNSEWNASEFYSRTREQHAQNLAKRFGDMDFVMEIAGALEGEAATAWYAAVRENGLFLFNLGNQRR
ncbi:MAG: hypothetical protein CL678_17660 [Bdellovibrionaceae bacterium]|nr:hypothetical protein [Pseudobdellovibrionaceae bacterium]